MKEGLLVLSQESLTPRPRPTTGPRPIRKWQLDWGGGAHAHVHRLTCEWWAGAHAQSLTRMCASLPLCKLNCMCSRVCRLATHTAQFPSPLPSQPGKLQRLGTTVLSYLFLAFRGIQSVFIFYCHFLSLDFLGSYTHS